MLDLILKILGIIGIGSLIGGVLYLYFFYQIKLDVRFESNPKGVKVGKDTIDFPINIPQERFGLLILTNNSRFKIQIEEIILCWDMIASMSFEGGFEVGRAKYATIGPTIKGGLEYFSATFRTSEKIDPKKVLIIPIRFPDSKIKSNLRIFSLIGKIVEPHFVIALIKKEGPLKEMIYDLR